MKIAMRILSFRLAITLTILCFLMVLNAQAQEKPAAQVNAKATAKTGEQIYKELCIGCHGPAGEGTKKYKKALTGDLSVNQLAKLVDETMPEENPELCVGEDARKVAEYINDAFYSVTAQARNKPPRVELVRLTNRQYQNAVMDLVGSFRGQGQKPEPKGLNGEYFSSRQMNRANRVIERVDPVIAFNFGGRRPHEPEEAEKKDAEKKDGDKKPAPGKEKPKDGDKKPDSAKKDEPKKPDAKPADAKPMEKKPLSFGPLEVALADPPQKPADKPKDGDKKPDMAKKEEPKKPEPAREPAKTGDKKPDMAKKDGAKKPADDPEEVKKKVEEQKRRQREAERKQRELQKKKDEEAKQFSARWQGSVIAPESGDYEFVVRTENAFNLWVNDNDKPLINAWVKSGNEKEFRQSIRLVGGRAYLIRLEMFKFREPTASIELAWKRPGMTVAEPITARYLSPTWNPKRFVVMTPFPPDDRSFGYERGIAISKVWESATTDAAIETANHILENLPELAGAKPGDADRREKLQKFAAKFAERAFRRPLTESQRKIYVDKQFEKTKDADLALRRAILLTLKSPRFLYLENTGEKPDGYDVASRLSFALWDSIPDQALLEAAGKGQLATPQQVAAQAERMSRDARARQKMREFLISWLRLEGTPDLSKDPKTFPEFTPEVIADLRSSLDMTLEDFVNSDKPDQRTLLSGGEWYANDRLAKVYGLKLPAGNGFRKTGGHEKEARAARTGVITHPYMLANLAYTKSTSPIHRGVFLSRNVIGRGIKAPPIAVAPLAPDLHPDLTTRERVIMQTSPTVCVTCHSNINPLGFALENYDAIGRWRDTEKGKPIDASGQYLDRTGSLRKFNGAAELSQFLTTAEEPQTAIVMQIFHHTVKQPILAYGLKVPEELRTAFAADGYDMRKLMARSASLAALGTKKAVEPKKPANVAARTENDRR